MIRMLAHRVAMTIVVTLVMTVATTAAMTPARRVHPVAMAMMVVMTPAMTLAVMVTMTVATGHVPSVPNRLRHADRPSSPSADSPCSRPRERGPQSPSRVRIDRKSVV